VTTVQTLRLGLARWLVPVFILVMTVREPLRAVHQLPGVSGSTQGARSDYQIIVRAWLVACTARSRGTI